MDLPEGQSAFLWGPRKKGKTTYLTAKFPKSTRYDLLQTDLFFRLSKGPHRLREELVALEEQGRLRLPILMDEIQKVPALLDEIHWLIENKKWNFVLCGSSARKLRQTHANMLGGRAWRFELFPLTSRELGKDFDLLKALNQGLIPSHYLSQHPSKGHQASIENYLKEEIQQEGLGQKHPVLRKISGFHILQQWRAGQLFQNCPRLRSRLEDRRRLLSDFGGYPGRSLFDALSQTAKKGCRIFLLENQGSAGS